MRADEQDRAAMRRLVSQLQRERAAQGLSQRDLAEMMGVSQATIAEFEASTSDPYLWTLQRYAGALGVKLMIDLARPPE